LNKPGKFPGVPGCSSTNAGYMVSLDIIFYFKFRDYASLKLKY
jgi:hypothetical protein